jgi:beta-lactamase class A
VSSRLSPVTLALFVVIGLASLGGGLLVGQRVGAPRPASAAAPRRGNEVASAPPVATTPVVRASSPTPPAAALRSTADLQAEVGELLTSNGAEGGVSLIELAGAQPETWSWSGDEQFVAASTYKLPLLMKDAQDIADKQASPSDQLCYEDGDWEDGYFSDYQAGDCYSRAELDQRVGHYSDNTAAHILVRYDGGADALNAYARAHGATESAFYDPNTTTSADLARLWQNEAEGRAGGAAAQRYLYPLLTDTAYEDGIPAGVPAGTTVVHKIGDLDNELNDAALVEQGPRGPYVLTICTDGASWSLIASVAHAVAQFESA